MLCSRCSEPVLPIVALDIDGTMGDYHRHFMAFAELYLYGRAPQSLDYESYTGELPYREWWCRRYRQPEQVWRDIKLAYRQGGMKRSMPCFNWAPRLTQELKLIPVEIWVTTTRPYLRLDNIDPDTRFWLGNNGIKFDHLLYDEDKYSQLLENVGLNRVCAVLDDLNEDLARASSLFGEDKCILVRRPHNRIHQEKWTTTPHEGIGIRRAVMDRVVQWATKNQSHATL